MTVRIAIDAIKGGVLAVIASALWWLLLSLWPAMSTEVNLTEAIRWLLDANHTLGFVVAGCSFLVGMAIGATGSRIEEDRMLVLLAVAGLGAGLVPVVILTGVLIQSGDFTVAELLETFYAGVQLGILYVPLAAPVMVPAVFVIEKWTRPGDANGS